MAAPLFDWIDDLEKLSENTDSREIALLARAILSLARQSGHQRDNNLEAFGQIEEIGRRQDDDER